MSDHARATGRFRRLVMSAAAALLALAVIVGLGELLCRALPAGRPALAWPSPLNYQQVIQPTLVEQTADDGSVWLVPGKLQTVHPAAVPRRTTERTFRIVLFGGSAAFAGEFEPGGGWPLIAERLLAQAYPERDVQVINLAVVGQSSSQALLRLDEALGFDPDLLVVYSGNNEALDLVGLYKVRDVSLRSLKLRDPLREHSALYRAMARLAGRVYRREIALDSQSAVHEHAWNAADWEYVSRRYERNLERMCDLAAAAGKPLILSTLVNSEERANRPDRCFVCDSWMGAPTSTAGNAQPQPLDWAFWLWWNNEAGRADELLNGLDRPIADSGLRIVRALIESGLEHFERSRELAAAEIADLERDERWRGHPVLGARYIVALKLAGREDEIREVNRQVLESIEAISPEDRLFLLARLAEFTGDDERLRQEIGTVLSASDDVIVTGRRLNPSVERVAQRRGAILWRPDVELRRANAAGRLGADALFDYCHFTHRGGHRMAALLAQTVADSGLLGAPTGPADFAAQAERWRRRPWDEGRDAVALDRFCGVGRNLINLEHSLPNNTSRSGAWIELFDSLNGSPEEQAWATDVRCRMDGVWPAHTTPRSLQRFDELLRRGDLTPELRLELLQSAAYCALWSLRPQAARTYIDELIELGDPEGLGRRLRMRLEDSQSPQPSPAVR